MMKMHYIGGVIETKHWGSFSKMIFRVSRGNVLIHNKDMTVSPDNKFVNQREKDIEFFNNKTVFLLAFE